MEIAVDPLQYQAIPIHLQFTNRSSEAIRVTQAEPSCGCTDLVTRGGSALLAPLVLSPGESLPWQATIHTEGRIGPQSFLVRLETESGGETVEHISTIRMNVKPAVAVAPARIEFADVMPGALESAEITLWDGHPDPGLRLNRIEVSDAERMEVEYHVADPRDGSASRAAGTASGLSFTPRYAVKFQFRAPETPSRAILHEQLRFVFDDPSHPPVVVPVMCRLQMPAFTLLPNQLWLTPDALGKTLRRTVRCEIGADTAVKLQVLQAPPFVQLEIADAGPHAKEVQLTLDVPQSAAALSKIDPILMGTTENESVAFSIPLKYLAAP